MRTIHLKINVPSWVPSRYDLDLFKPKLKFKLNPPCCEKCKCKLDTREFYYGHKVNGKYYGYNVNQMFAVRSYAKWCKACMKKYVHSLEKTKGNCTLCGSKDVDVMGYYYGKEDKVIITFLWGHWNGNEFCMDCVNTLLDNGTRQTDIYQLKGNRTYPIYY